MRPDFSQPLCVLPTFDLRPFVRAFCDAEEPSIRPTPQEPERVATDGSLVVPFHGFVCEDAGEWWGGAVRPSAVMRALDDALARGLAVTLDVDSPGGIIKGVAELAAYIRAAVRDGAEIRAFTRGQCCSAAYWVASQCKTITATRGAHIGNCGAYAVYMDWSEADAKAGLRSVLFSSGELKTAGLPEFALTEAQRTFLAAHIDALASMFFIDVFAARPKADAEAVRSGGWWLAVRAQALGLIDHVALDIPNTIHKETV